MHWKKHVLLATVAGGLIVAAWFAAVAQDLTGIKPPGIDPGELIWGAVAVALSIPALGALVFFATRKTLGRAWRYADGATRGLFVLYVAVEWDPRHSYRVACLRPLATAAFPSRETAGAL